MKIVLKLYSLNYYHHFTSKSLRKITAINLMIFVATKESKAIISNYHLNKLNLLFHQFFNLMLSFLHYGSLHKASLFAKFK